MNHLTYPIKTITERWWRSLILGGFIFIVTLVLVFFRAYSVTIITNMQDSLINILLGHIQIRPAGDTEQDIADLSNMQWEGLHFLDSTDISSVKNICDMPGYSMVNRIRYGGVIISDNDKEPGFFIGLDPLTAEYKQSLHIISGTYLEPNKKNQIVLEEGLANQLKVHVGDKVTVLTRSKTGYMAELPLTVVGIGSLDILSALGVKVSFTDIDGVQESMGINQSQFTDISLYLSNKNSTPLVLKHLSEVLSRDHLHVTSFQGMGGFIIGFVRIISGMFYVLTLFLMCIIAVLIYNLMYQAGIERYKEIGLLRAIGFSKNKIIEMFMIETTLISGIAFCLAISTAYLFIYYFSRAGMPPLLTIWKVITGERIYMIFNPVQSVPILLIMILFTFLGSWYPSVRAVRHDPANILKD